LNLDEKMSVKMIGCLHTNNGLSSGVTSHYAGYRQKYKDSSKALR
jgi:hypothetical protein